MEYLLDTNILLKMIRGDQNFDHRYYISIVTKAELLSLSVQFNWGEFKKQKLIQNLAQINIINITDEIVQSYVEIDTFSQKKHPALVYQGTARNMGKNDIWIAATAHILNLKLVTTDHDFDHLENTFISIQKESF